MFAPSSYAQSPGAPTVAESASEIDQVWQEANNKYDQRRESILIQVKHVAETGPYRPDWGSLERYQPPEWYKDAKFGIFIHWGVYSVPAFGSEWYPRLMYTEGSPEYKHQLATYGPLTSFGYKDFISLFKAEHFDPQAWARVFRQTGARYVVPVFEHHDGFAMYDSSLSDWTAVKMGPRRDVLGELAKAVRAEGLHLGASSHRVEHDWFLENGRKLPSDVNDPKYAAFYGPAHPRLQDDDENLIEDWTYVSPAYLRDWLARSAEIVEKYHPDLMYFDWWIGQASVRPYLTRFAAYYYNESSQRGCVGVINYKEHAMRRGSGVVDIERGQLSGINKDYWQTDTSVSNLSWGYIQHDTFKTPEFIVHQLADIVSKNGNLLLNVGPRSDGSIPEQVQDVLLSVGAWLKINGEAIYGTRPWKVYGEGPTRVTGGSFHDTETKPYTPQDFRFTTKGAALYAIELGWPANGETVIHALGTAMSGAGTKIGSVSLLGSSATISYEQRTDGLHLRLPATPPSPYAVSFRILLSSKLARRPGDRPSRRKWAKKSSNSSSPAE
jgi:alpha-L-fucosidase